ncbi:MAG TPA: YciI family protein [Blastocatellia bacterium]|nr:YciI family protein [Blastocatellia bacterium]
MKYLLLIYFAEQEVSEPEWEECYLRCTELVRQLRMSGQYLAGHPLYPTSTATSVRVRDGNRLLTDGPFAETREQLGGYYLVEAPDLDRAIGIAALIPGARLGTVEIRPVMELDGMPADLLASASDHE